MVVYIEFLSFIFTIGTGADNSWYSCTFLVQKITIFPMGVPHFKVKFHVLGLPVRNEFSDS